MPRYLKPRESAEYMRCSVSTFHRRCRDGLLRHSNRNGTRLSTHQWIDQFFEGAIETGLNVKLRVTKPGLAAAEAYLESLKGLERHVERPRAKARG